MLLLIWQTSTCLCRNKVIAFEIRPTPCPRQLNRHWALEWRLTVASCSLSCDAIFSCCCVRPSRSDGGGPIWCWIRPHAWRPLLCGEANLKTGEQSLMRKPLVCYTMRCHSCLKMNSVPNARRMSLPDDLTIHHINGTVMKPYGQIELAPDAPTHFIFINIFLISFTLKTCHILHCHLDSFDPDCRG